MSSEIVEVNLPKAKEDFMIIRGRLPKRRQSEELAICSMNRGGWRVFEPWHEGWIVIGYDKNLDGREWLRSGGVLRVWA
jgi:hypothetical protein